MTQPIRFWTAAVLPAVMLTITACSPRENPELQWAHAALQRNPNVEIVAVDNQTGVFTLRDKRTGAMQAVGLNELAAAPMDRLELVNNSSREGATSPETASGGAATSPATQQSEPAALAGNAPVTPRESATQSESAAPEQSATSPATMAAAKPYTIERNGGQLRVSGPGISVVSAATSNAPAQNKQAQRAVDPIICEGSRLLHVDNRDIHVDGDAIVARGGCELYITNSTVVGARTGLVVQDAMVHIANSRIEGAIASFEAGSNARLFVRGSTFHGVSRREEGATVQDQGGNRWQ